MDYENGSRKYDWWRGDMVSRKARPIGICVLCSGPIMTNESWHANGFRLVHMRCEYQELEDRLKEGL